MDALRGELKFHICENFCGPRYGLIVVSGFELCKH